MTPRPSAAPKARKARASQPGPPEFRFWRGSDRPDVLGLQALRALGHLEADLLAFGQASEALGLDGRVVAEDILAAVVLSDKAKTLRIIEPLHRTGCHVLPSLIGRQSPGPCMLQGKRNLQASAG